MRGVVETLSQYLAALVPFEPGLRAVDSDIEIVFFATGDLRADECTFGAIFEPNRMLASSSILRPATKLLSYCSPERRSRRSGRVMIIVWSLIIIRPAFCQSCITLLTLSRETPTKLPISR